MGLTAVTYITCLGLIQYRCLLNDLQYIQSKAYVFRLLSQSAKTE